MLMMSPRTTASSSSVCLFRCVEPCTQLELVSLLGVAAASVLATAVCSWLAMMIDCDIAPSCGQKILRCRRSFAETGFSSLRRTCEDRLLEFVADFSGFNESPCEDRLLEFVADFSAFN